MYKFLFFFFFPIVTAFYTNAQTFPKESSNLNYRIIGFSFPKVHQATDYTIEVALGNYHKEDSFKNNIIYSLNTKKNKQIIEVPFFGKEYTWRYVCKHNNTTTTGNLYHFSVAIIPDVDTNKIRLRIIDSALKYKDAFILVDGNKAMYDMRGNPVWFMPETESLNHDNTKIVDLKFTPQGTITFLIGKNIYEVNYNGDILWKGPNNDKLKNDGLTEYHHEFTRLNSGHYMTMGIEYVPWTIPPDTNNLGTHPNTIDTTVQINRKKNKTPFGTLIELDQKGNVVWSWKSSVYFKSSDMIYRKPQKGMLDVHENSFYFDEKNKVIYISFKNIDRILKVKYPEGNVLNVYGKKYIPGGEEIGNELFCGQHTCKSSMDGYLYVYNNNSCNSPALPQIIIMKQQASGRGDSLEKIWEYQCSINDKIVQDQEPVISSNNGSLTVIRNHEDVMSSFSKGGNAIELPDRSIFVNMCGTYSKVFIVDRDKKILWDAVPEIWDDSQKKWGPVYNYRSSIIIGTNDIERLIWNAEKK